MRLGRQASIGGLRPGRGTSRTPFSQSRSASQWMAATTFRVTEGSEKNERNNSWVVRRRRCPIEGCRKQRAFAVGLENAQFDAVIRRHDPEMVAHRHLDKGRHVKPLVLRLADAGRADLAALHREHIGMDIAEGVADFVDEEGGLRRPRDSRSKPTAD